MKTIDQKILESRSKLGLSQKELAELTGVSSRSVLAYEKGDKKPRQTTLYALAKALNVSVKYLSDDSCTDPQEDIEADAYLEEVHKEVGTSGTRDLAKMLKENEALFAGGELSQAEKDIYFDAIMTAYVNCKQKAKEKFGKK